jgi:hypothetical protein
MARIVYSALIESIRGSIGGTTFQKNAYGYTVKTKPNMCKPNTQNQQAQKILFRLAVSAWTGLTNAQRADWDTWASTYPQYAKHNPTSQLSGFAVFTRVHVYRFMTGEGIDTNPSYFNYNVDTLTFSVTLAAGVLRIVVDSLLEEESWRIPLFISRPFSDSQNFVGTRTRYVTWTTSADQSLVITSAYTDKYGILPAIGQKLAVRAICYGDGTGHVLAPQDTVLDVTAP